MRPMDPVNFGLLPFLTMPWKTGRPPVAGEHQGERSPHIEQHPAQRIGQAEIPGPFMDQSFAERKAS
jgi:hypothetical protein